MSGWKNISDSKAQQLSLSCAMEFSQINKQKGFFGFVILRIIRIQERLNGKLNVEILNDSKEMQRQNPKFVLKNPQNNAHQQK